MLRKKSKVALTSASRRRTLFAALIFALICGRSVEADAPQVINHDEVRGFPDSTSEFLKTYQPYLKVNSGCVPFPAVDAAGNVSGGLKPSGFASDGCSKNLGQIYVRADEFEGECAVMYSWFFPKNKIGDWPTDVGSRYDWQNVIVWLSSCDGQAHVNAVSYWSNRGYHTTTKPHMDGTHPLVAYVHDYSIGHRVVGTRTRGGMQPAISWFDLTYEAMFTLDLYDFGVSVPFITRNFYQNLARAYYR
ncbi:NPP1 family protein [Rhizobium leguminosarum]|uniref:NPP1 family protein n=1 Tax=Rhizobium leguminosarum TaxID=384 RepID=UPI0019810CBA|nr:necrosis-inducing protein [Rhizobium leguminosarum bv. viciae]NKK17391.1 necrosis-inducing protein [Rhizobium leguminosarum bv. viciae]